MATIPTRPVSASQLVPNRHHYEEIAALIAVIGDRWFCRTLQCVLQDFFHFDYFLLTHYHRGQPLRVLANDMHGVEALRAVHWLERETYVLEPIYRLHEEGLAVDGVYDMSTLVSMLPSVLPADTDPALLSHLVEDADEEIGWRTMGWPRHQQETCVLLKTGKRTLLAISMYNMELDRPAPQPATLLYAMFPVLAAVLRQHVESPAWRDAINPAGCEAATAPPGHTAETGKPAVVQMIRRYFEDTLQVALTERELAVFERLLNGATVPAIAQALDISVNTVRTHRRNVYQRIGYGNLPELINGFYRDIERQQQQEA